MMRWRTATEEVAASATSSTTSTSRRSLNEQAEDPDHTTTQDNSPEMNILEAAAESDSMSSAGPTRGQKRALEEEKKLASAVEAEPPDTADTSTDTDVSNTAQENARARSNGGSSRKASVDNEDDDDDDEGADHAEDESTPAITIAWKPQSVQSTCEFTHTILDYSQKRESGCKKAEYSAVTQDELGNRWRLIVYVNGNGRASNHHLSLFLQVADADDLPFGWKKAVSYVLTLEHPTAGATLSYAKRNPDKTFKLCPKAIDWGWSQFITSDRIQQEGFVKVDTLTVRAQVTVKSSSVSIDEEDAELYLKCAVEEGDAKSVKLCLEQGASVNCQFKDDLYTPLHTACSSGTNTGSMEVLNLLLEEGADGNACNKWKETPLLIAANNGHRAAVEALLKHGANPSLCSEAGWSALTFAAHKVCTSVIHCSTCLHLHTRDLYISRIWSAFSYDSL
jgi:Ankyrin repeats (3 copies)/MATH domain